MSTITKSVNLHAIPFPCAACGTPIRMHDVVHTFIVPPFEHVGVEACSQQCANILARMNDEKHNRVVERAYLQRKIAELDERGVSQLTVRRFLVDELQRTQAGIANAEEMLRPTHEIRPIERSEP